MLHFVTFDSQIVVRALGRFRAIKKKAVKFMSTLKFVASNLQSHFTRVLLRMAVKKRYLISGVTVSTAGASLITHNLPLFNMVVRKAPAVAPMLQYHYLSASLNDVQVK